MCCCWAHRYSKFSTFDIVIHATCLMRVKLLLFLSYFSFLYVRAHIFSMNRCDLEMVFHPPLWLRLRTRFLPTLETRKLIKRGQRKKSGKVEKGLNWIISEIAVNILSLKLKKFISKLHVMKNLFFFLHLFPSFMVLNSSTRQCSEHKHNWDES